MDHPGASAQRPSCWTGSPNAQGSEAVERNPKTRVKSAIKAGIRRVVRHLPWGVEQAILDAIVAHRGGFRIIGQLFPRNITGTLYANGDYGLIQSVADDWLILPIYANHKTWAKSVCRVFAEFFQERGGGTYLDIGANIGLTTIPIARNNQVSCHSFEPDPDLFAHLYENIRRNCGGNVELHQLALGAENAEVSFSINTRGNRGNNRIAEKGALKVRVARLDDLCLDCPEPLAAKIDTEGFEPFVLQGGWRVLGKADLVAIEFHPHQIRTAGGDPDRVIEFLAGFRQLAVLPGESDQKPIYERTETICSHLRDYAADIRDEIKYLDVIGRR